MRRMPARVVVACLVAAAGNAGFVAAAEAQSAPSDPEVTAALAVDLPEPRDGGARVPQQGDPFARLGQDSLLDTLGDLTAIRAYEGWRHSTSSGESSAIRYVEQRLRQMIFLRAIGLETERLPFRTYLGVEFHETRVRLGIDGRFVEVDAQGAPGDREDLDLAMRFDSDGILNDRDRNPVIVVGPPLLVRTAARINSLTPAQAAGRVILVDYALIDRAILGNGEAIARAQSLADNHPAGLVMVTSFSNVNGESHGSFAGDLPAVTWVEVDPVVPILTLRLEDLGGAGITDWGDFAAVDEVQMTWDVDLFSPGESESLIARIPGEDPSRAVILGAHIDSPNSPGGMDDGSGSTALVEVARALSRSKTRPPVDLYLVWFGSHERGVYGSNVFTANYSELLDRSIAMLQMDCLGHPVDGMLNHITLESWSYYRYGDGRTPWIDYLGAAAAGHGVATLEVDYWGLVSDNSQFNGYDVPNANLIYMDPFDPTEVHYGNHLHDPYETVELAALEADVFEDMARVLTIAAIEAAADAPETRVTPPPDRRALFVGSHTEGCHMAPSSLTGFGMALAWQGFDVDMVPYGRALTAADLADTDLVIALPVHDYPSPEGDVSLYDEAWTEPELDALDDWVAAGGRLLLTNTAHRLKYYNFMYEDNEDWSDVNALAGRFGVTFLEELVRGTIATPVGDHPLMAGQSHFSLLVSNAHEFTAPGAEEVARAVLVPVVALLRHGAGEVLVVADLGILGTDGDPPRNLPFWLNLADWAR